MVGDRGSERALGDTSGDGGHGVVGPGSHGTAPDVGRAGDEARQSGDRAFEGRPTQAASRGEPIYNPAKGAKYVGESINAQGNELALRKREAGRFFKRAKGADRPVGFSSARFHTGVNPEESVTGTFLPRP